MDEEVCFTVLSFLNNNLSLIITFSVGIISSYLVYKVSSDANRRQHNRYEMDLINKSLTEFYYPFLLLVKTNTEMFRAFSQKKFQEEPNFSTLEALLREASFTPNEMALLDEIIKNNRKLLELIECHGNQVDNYQLIQNLAQASNHFRIIILAHEKKILHDENLFKNYTYPTNLVVNTEKVIQEKVTQLDKLKK